MCVSPLKVNSFYPPQNWIKFIPFNTWLLHYLSNQLWFLCQVMEFILFRKIVNFKCWMNLLLILFYWLIDWIRQRLCSVGNLFGIDLRSFDEWLALAWPPNWNKWARWVCRDQSSCFLLVQLQPKSRIPNNPMVTRLCHCNNLNSFDPCNSIQE